MTARPEDRLRDVPAPGEGEARARALAVARAAVRSPAPGRRPRRRRRWVLGLAGAAGAAGLALSPAGAAVPEWVGDRARSVLASDDRLPALGPLEEPPGGGRLLLLARRPHDGSPGTAFPWIGTGAGPRRVFGVVDDASWSPRGRFVAVTRGLELIALDPHARPRSERRWSLSAPGPARRPRWSPSGFRIAYLVNDGLRVVAGDGTGDRAVGPAGPAAPAWRPGRLHQLAYADRSGRVVLIDVDRRRVLWRSRPHLPPRSLSWSADGRRLLAVAARKTYVLGGGGGLVRHARAPAGTTNVTGAYAPGGRAYALLRRSPGGETRVLHADGARQRFLFGFPGAPGGLAWSPDGRWLAVGVPRADTLVFLRPGRDGLAGARSADGITRRLDGAVTTRVAGWCCAR